MTLYFLIFSIVFVEFYRIDNIVRLLKNLVDMRDIFISVTEDIHIGLIEIADSYGGF